MRTLLHLAALALGAMLALGASLGAQEIVEGFDDPVLDARYRDLIHEIRCMKCQNQSIAESPIDQAGDIRRQVRVLMADGMSDAEIRSYLADRYGDFINYRPPFKPSTWLLWSAPVLLLGGGAFVFARVLRERMGQPLDEDLD
jgi:cytochrome c-type biogenesis protein CcmH